MLSAEERKRKYIKEYTKKNYKQIYLILKRDEDADILDYLAEIKERDGVSPSQLFKFCVRKEIEND